MNKQVLTSAICAILLCTSLPTANAANNVTAIPTYDKGQTIYVDSIRVYPTAYNIEDNNYFKLSDLSLLVGFNLSWDGNTKTVCIDTTRVPPSYSTSPFSSPTPSTAKLSSQNFTLNGSNFKINSYLIAGCNYVKLRDIAQAVDFGVSYDATTKAINISSHASYENSNKTPIIPINVSNQTLHQWKQQMINCINAERSKAGVSPLSISEDLTQWAQYWAQHLTIEYRDSLESDKIAFSKANNIDFRALLGPENIITGCPVSLNPVESDMDKFMASTYHRDNILNPVNTYVGIGFALSADGQYVYCCQSFR